MARGFNFEYSAGYEKAISKMGIAFAPNWPQRLSCNNIELDFVVVQPQSQQNFALFYNRGKNKNSQ